MTTPNPALPSIQLVTVQPRPLNERLWELHRKCADRSATPSELTELDAMCAALETRQDISLWRKADG